MTNYTTIEKLTEMRLSAMANAFRTQLEDVTMRDIPFEDRFGMLVDIEYANRKSNRLKGLSRMPVWSKQMLLLQMLITLPEESSTSL